MTVIPRGFESKVMHPKVTNVYLKPLALAATFFANGCLLTPKKSVYSSVVHIGGRVCGRKIFDLLILHSGHSMGHTVSAVIERHSIRTPPM